MQTSGANHLDAADVWESTSAGLRSNTIPPTSQRSWRNGRPGHLVKGNRFCSEKWHTLNDWKPATFRIICIFECRIFQSLQPKCRLNVSSEILKPRNYWIFHALRYTYARDTKANNFLSRSKTVCRSEVKGAIIHLTNYNQVQNVRREAVIL